MQLTLSPSTTEIKSSSFHSAIFLFLPSFPKKVLMLSSSAEAKAFRSVDRADTKLSDSLRRRRRRRRRGKGHPAVIGEEEEGAAPRYRGEGLFKARRRRCSLVLFWHRSRCCCCCCCCCFCCCFCSCCCWWCCLSLQLLVLLMQWLLLPICCYTDFTCQPGAKL